MNAVLLKLPAPRQRTLRERALVVVRGLILETPSASDECVALAQCYLSLRRIDARERTS